MDGPQDLGGRAGFGPIAPEPDEPIFHHDWERRALGLTLAAGALGYWTLDESRHARESLPPAVYYGASYYEIWIMALENLLKRHGEVTEEELAQARVLQPGVKTDRKLVAEHVPNVLARGGPVDRPLATTPRYAAGDRVRTRKMHPKGHTRLPAYARDKEGVVEAVIGSHVFPDTSAHGGGEAPQWLYTVVFNGTELWGPDGSHGLTVSVDAWESYLEPA